MGDAYSAIGGLFEYLNQDCGYEQWSQYLIEKVSALTGARGIDIGCGNGYFTRAFYKRGNPMTGVDVSARMLSRAQELALAEGVRAEFLLGDITKLKIAGEKFDFAISVNDCFNYIPPQNLARAFKNAAKILKRGAVFIFDISTEYKLKNVLGNNLFADDGEDFTYIWYNRLFSDRVEMEITLFSRGDDGKYTRADEKHIQYIHTEASVSAALKAAGFISSVEGHLGKSKKERINFICKKL